MHELFLEQYNICVSEPCFIVSRVSCVLCALVAVSHSSSQVIQQQHLSLRPTAQILLLLLYLATTAYIRVCSKQLLAHHEPYQQKEAL